MMLTDIQKRLVELAKEKIDTDIPLSIDTELENLLNSITYIQFLIACEDEFEIEIDDDELDMSNFFTLGDIAKYIEKSLNQNE